MSDKVKFLDVVQNKVDARKYNIEGYFHYLYITNVKPVEDVSSVLKLDYKETLVNIDNIPKVLLSANDTDVGDDAPNHLEESIGVCSVVALEIDKDSIAEAMPRMNIEIAIVDDSLPVYGIFYIDTVDSEYMPLGIKPNIDHNDISAIYFGKKSTIDHTEVFDSAENPSLSCEKFRKHLTSVYRCNPQIENKAFVTVYDDKSIDAMIAATVFAFSLGSNRSTMMSLSDYNKDKENDPRKAIIILGIDSNVAIEENSNTTIVSPYGMSKTISSEISVFMDSFVSLSSADSKMPATVNYLTTVLDPLTDVNLARYDTIIMSLYSLLSFNGHVGFMDMTFSFLTSLNNVDTSILGKYLADSLGVHYSNAVRKTDSIFHSIQTVDNNIINHSSGDISVYGMHATEYEVEAMLEYIRTTKTGGKYILTNEKINSEAKTIEYKFTTIGYDDDSSEDILMLLQCNILKNISMISEESNMLTQNTDRYPVSYPLPYIKEDMVSDDAIAVYSLSISLSSIFSVL